MQIRQEIRSQDSGRPACKLLEVTGLVKRYEGFTLEGVSLSLEPGCVIGLVGSNGAGKTTVLKSVLGLVLPDGGSVRLLGEEVFPGGGASDRVKQRVGVVFDTCAFPGDCRVADVAAMGRALFDNWDGARWDELARRFALPRKKKVSELSRGMGMKLSLAFALAHGPELLILDEATAGIDPLARDEVLDILREFMADGRRGILMSSHITTDLEKLADKVVCLDAGKVVFSAPKEAITDEAGIARCRAVDLEAVLASGLTGASAEASVASAATSTSVSTDAPVVSASAPIDASPAVSPDGSAARISAAPLRLADASSVAPVAEMYVLRGAYGSDLLVPDRFAFSRVFPDVPVDKATLEEYLTLRLKGEKL